MPVKLNIGLSRKVGEPNYGSRGASVHLEVELDSGVLQNAAQLRERVRDLYQLARQSVDEELHRPDGDPSPDHREERPTNRLNGHTQTPASRNGHRANGVADVHADGDQQQASADARTSGHVSGPSNGYANGHANARVNGNGHARRQADERSQASGRRTVEVARASQSQIRAIFAITKRLGLDAGAVIQERYRVYRMEELTMREASALIDELKGDTGARS